MKKYVSQRMGHAIVLIMRWSTLILLFICSTALTVSAHHALAQDILKKRITIDLKQESLAKSLEEISEKSGVKFTYGGAIAKSDQKISAVAKNQELGSFLDKMLNGLPYSYLVIDNEIAIKYDQTNEVPKKQPVIFPANIRVLGKVTDENGVPLQGASIKVKGTSNIAITNETGQFTLNNVPEKAILVVTFVGYETQEVSVAGDLMVSLVKSSSKLDEIKIIGYGTTTERLSTGNVSSVKADIIGSQPITNPLQALEGRVAGLQITQGNGLPGSPIQVQIRGRSSIAALNNPLYIVDGVPFTSTPVEIVVPANGTGQTNGTGNGSPLNSINPDDIESIDILKDADETAIYGSRAANGVILITTKKGKAGKTNLSVKVNTGAGQITPIPSMLNTQQYLQLRKDALANSGLTPTVSNAYDLLSYDPNTNTDWQKWYMGRTSKITDVNSTLSGGDQQTTYLLSGTYHHESTVEPTNDGYDRGNFHMSVTHNSLDKKFQINASIFYTADNLELPSGYAGLVQTVSRLIPNYPTYNSTGGYNWVNGKTNVPATISAYYKSQTDNFNGNVNLRYTLLPGLDFKSNLGYNKIQVNQIGAYPAEANNPSLAIGAYSNFGNQFIQTYLFEPQLTYTKHISKGKLDLLAGSTVQQNSTVGQSVFVSGYTNDLQIESLNFGTVGSKSANTIQYKYMSVFGRLTYNWEDTYIIDGTFRRDGSSRFGPGKQFGNFGSVGGAWLFSNGSFVKDELPALSFGKLRASYGTTGSDAIGDYGYLSLYSSSVNYGTVPTLIPSQISNANFQWEVTKKLEFALDLGLFKDRVLISSSWYRNRSDNELVAYSLPSVTGFSSYIANLPAVVQNKGWEFEINTRNIEKEKFKWTTSLNLTIPQNKLISFPGLSTSSYANSLIVGQSLNVVQKFRFEGVDPKTGLVMIEDVNHDGNYTQTSSYNNQQGDYVIAGTTDPKWYGGLSNTVSYRDFQLTVFFQYVRQSGYNLISQDGGVFGLQDNVWTSFSNYWKQPGDQVSIPKPFGASNATLLEWQNSTAAFSDASFLRLKNLSVSYNLPKQLIERLKVNALKVYLQGQNIWTLTKYSGYDPEMAGNPSLMIPSLKILTIGLQCTL
jgi:TonB-linked SusC/RagA family outer membrane protein